ncbi:MAG: class B sortase [Erysipelotrichia bacterium]|nr:class B sortase [Erysipelotrichia bacterium]NCC54119.1 class B sortase [Erysipelotrichia bacterium]
MITRIVGDKMAKEKQGKKAKKNSQFRKIIDTVIFVVAVCVFCYAGFNLYKIYQANHEEKKETEHLRKLADVPSNEKGLENFSVDFDKLKKLNQDIVAWIVVKDTEISYPVVQGSDNDYYLTHTFEKKNNYAGAIFMDYTASPDFSDQNTFIYGHNVYHGTMFAELANYMDQAFFNAHPYIYLYTPQGNYKLQVFSAYVDKADSTSYRMGFASEQEFQNYLNEVNAKSKYASGVEVSSVDRIVTLYTCSYENGQNPTNSDAEYIDERYYIHAKIVKELNTGE